MGTASSSQHQQQRVTAPSSASSYVTPLLFTDWSITMATTTTVVTKQVTSSSGGGTVVTTGNRDWSSGLCACFDDCKICMCVAFCTPCYACKISQRVGEHCCVPLCAGGILPLRQKIRMMLGIQGSICNDCLTLWMCGHCALCQMGRELDAAGWPQ